MSWWRRNRAALLGAPVVVLAAGWMTGDDLVRQWRDERAEIPQVAVGEAVIWEGVAFRVAAITPTSTDDDPDLPAGTQLVHAAVEVVLPDDPRDDYPLCRVDLVDVDGRVFTSSPIDVFARTDRLCLPLLDGSESVITREYEFLLPSDAEPRALRLGTGAGDRFDLLVDRS